MKRVWALICLVLFFGLPGCAPGEQGNEIEPTINEGHGNSFLVPAGQFSMGDNYDEGSYDGETPRERPVHTVYLDAYYIGEFEVINKEYQRFMDDGGYESDEYWSKSAISG
jgi:formylglycine-generating enzyme required for sulfatase activity